MLLSNYLEEGMHTMIILDEGSLGFKFIFTFVPGYFSGYAQNEFLSVHSLASRASKESENLAIIPKPLAILSAKKYFFLEGRAGFHSMSTEIEYESISYKYYGISSLSVF